MGQGGRKTNEKRERERERGKRNAYRETCIRVDAKSATATDKERRNRTLNLLGDAIVPNMESSVD